MINSDPDPDPAGNIMGAIREMMRMEQPKSNRQSWQVYPPWN